MNNLLAVILVTQLALSAQQRQKAQTTLTEFQSNASSWQLVDQILEQSSCLQSKVRTHTRMLCTNA